MNSNTTQLNEAELNAVLYYADFLSLLAKSIPVTDICTYFFVYNAPVNAAFIVGHKPIYDENNEYFKQSKEEYALLRDKFGEDGVMSFIDNISSLSVCGRVTGNDMLRCIHRYSQKRERADALNKYNKYMKNLKYTHEIKDEDGKKHTRECSKYIAHYEIAKRMATRPEIHNGIEEITKETN